MPIATLRQIYAVVKMANRTHVSGDGTLFSVTVRLGENDRAHTCVVALADPFQQTGGALFKQSFEAGGIAAPAELINPKTTEAASNSVAGGFSGIGDLPGDGAAIVQECVKQGIIARPQVAYILATVQHETDNTYLPIEEYQGPSLWYAPYYGRGYVQLTHKENYEKYSTILGQDLVSNPEKVLQAKESAFILVHGFRTGTFTGVSLSDYIDGEKKDYVNARRIINGTDRAALIAGYAREWEVKLDGLTVDTEDTPPVGAESAIAPEQAELVDAKETAPTEISSKGTELIIALGEAFVNLQQFHFIHTGTTVSVRPNTVTYRGQAVRWLLSRRKTNTTYQNITLRELAQVVCDHHGLILEMDGDGPTYAFLDQTGLSNFGLLRRECAAVGFLIQERSNQLIIGPLRPDFTGFVIVPEMIVGSMSFVDSASADMPANRPTGIAGEQKVEINASTGQIVQVRPEDSRGTMDSTVTGESAARVYGTIAVSDEEAALPSQQTGAIALSTGETRAAEQLKSELKRVQGYQSKVTLRMTGASLTIVPGNVIAIDPRVAGPVFAREWRVSDVTHSVGADAVPTTALTFYTPQAAVPGGASNDEAPSEEGEDEGPVTGSGYGFPYAKGRSTIGDGIGLRDAATGRWHHGLDLAADNGEPLFAMKAGAVIDVEKRGTGFGGGYGNLCHIRHADGFETFYAHMQTVGVSIGDEVRQGQVIGRTGNTGRSFGPHLHLELRKGGDKFPLSAVGINVEDYADGTKRAGFEY